MNIGTAYLYGGTPSCLPVVGSPGVTNVQTPFKDRLEAENFDVETREYLWSNEQSLPTPATEECAGPQAFVSFPVGVVSSPTSDPATLSTHDPTGFVGSRDDTMGEHDGGMGRPSMGPIATTPASLEDRFEMILETCKAAGFHSVDSMATEYYTASFPHNSHLAATQSRSRSRDLPDLLDNLYAASSAWGQERQNPWAFNESERFREKILRLATNILIDEASQIERVHDQAAVVAPPVAEEGNDQVSPGGLSTNCQWCVKEEVSLKKMRLLSTYWLTNHDVKVPETRSSPSEFPGPFGVPESLVPHQYMPGCGSLSL